MRAYGKNRRDVNEPAIIATLEAHGCTVERLHTPLDLLVGFGGQTFLVEVKQPNGKMTGTQTEFLETWTGNAWVLRTEEQAERWASALRRGEVPEVGMVK